MKRRKKLWIACVALVVVALVCAFALFYRPTPYRFLRGAELDLSESRPSQFATSENVMLTYEIERPVEVVITEARKELTSAKGWKWTPEFAEGYVPGCQLDSGETWISFISTWPPVPGRPIGTTVTLVRPATLTDRFLNWMHNR